MPKSNYLNTVVLNIALRNQPFSPPANIYVALYTTAPTAAGGGVEVVGGSYSRQPVTFSVPVSQTTSNVSAVTFPIASANWGSLVAFAYFDAPVGGNMLYFANLSTPRTVNTNDQFVFPASQLVCVES